MEDMSFTNRLKLYTASQFESVITKTNTLLFGSFTSLMIFIQGHLEKLLTDSKKKKLLIAAGICGLIYSNAFLIDGFARPKFPEIRTFAEVSVVSGTLTLWFLIMVIFGDFGWALGPISFLITTIGFGILVKKFPTGDDINRGEKTDARLDLVVQEMLKSEEGKRDLRCMTLMALLIKPDEQATSVIYTAYEATTTINVVYQENRDSAESTRVTGQGTVPPTEVTGGEPSNVAGDQPDPPSSEPEITEVREDTKRKTA